MNLKPKSQMFYLKIVTRPLSCVAAPGWVASNFQVYTPSGHNQCPE